MKFIFASVSLLTFVTSVLSLPKSDLLPRQKCSSLKVQAAYYAGWSVDRPCNASPPEKIPTEGLTHLIYSFAFFDPSTYDLYFEAAFSDANLKKFINLGPKPVIAIGGWNFNEPGPTRTAFSDMAGSPENRARWIKKVDEFATAKGFKGIDIDWEYPVAPERGGKAGDKENLTALLKEMRAAWGKKYDLSIAIPADQWSRSGFDLKAISEQVDFINVMTYDFPPPNANTVFAHNGLKQGAIYVNQYIAEGVPPGKINYGMGSYSRTFQLKDATCKTQGCAVAAPGKAAKCSMAPGFMLNSEIAQLVAEKNIKPTLMEGEALKEFVYDNDQWVSYEDKESKQLRKDWAMSLCLNGVFSWSIDQETQKA